MLCSILTLFFTLAAVQLPRWRLAASRPGIPAPNQRGHAWTGARVWEEPLWDRERARLCVALPHLSSQGKNARIYAHTRGLWAARHYSNGRGLVHLSFKLPLDVRVRLLVGIFRNCKRIRAGAFLKSAFRCTFSSSVDSWSLSWCGQRWGPMCASRGQCGHSPVNAI